MTSSVAGTFVLIAYPFETCSAIHGTFLRVREVPDVPFPGWEPPSYRVDDHGKVVGAEPGPHHNWGRFGELDQIGTANHLTPERIAAAAALVRTGKRFSLALPIGPPTPGGYRSEPLHFYGMAAGDGVLGSGRGGARYPVSDDYIVMALQASTQLDGFGHVGGDSTLYNGYWAGLVTATGGARRLGVHHLARGIVGPHGPARRSAASRRGAPRSRLPDRARRARRHGRRAERSAWVPATSCSCTPVTSAGSSASRPVPPTPRPAASPVSRPTAIPWLHDHDVAMIADGHRGVLGRPRRTGRRIPHLARRRSARPRAPRGPALRPRRARRRLRGRRCVGGLLRRRADADRGRERLSAEPDRGEVARCAVRLPPAKP